MARVNVKASIPPVFTHEGAPAFPHTSDIQQLRRSVLSCMLWEDEFYESGQKIADRIYSLALTCSPGDVARLAIEARSEFNLRHAPLILLCALAKIGKGSHVVSDTIYETIQRADELSELLAVYWRNGKTPIAAQMKKGLARAFTKFNAYSLAKYNRDSAIKLRDVLFMVKAKPMDAEQAALWKGLVDGTLLPPDTWEVNLSGGADKKATFERLIVEGKLGYLALLRNLRNMVTAGCDLGLVSTAIESRKNGADRVLPFRYVAAASACPQLEPAIDRALLAAIGEMPCLDGKTIVLVDVSGSMASALSAKSDMQRIEAAAALASIIPGDVRVFSFSEKMVEVPPRRGMSGVDAVINSQPRGNTYLGRAVHEINKLPHDRLIVISDEQSHDPVPNPVAKNAYMINVASNQNGVGYGAWTHLDGFSERVLTWINEYEKADLL